MGVETIFILMDKAGNITQNSLVSNEEIDNLKLGDIELFSKYRLSISENKWIVFGSDGHNKYRYSIISSEK